MSTLESHPWEAANILRGSPLDIVRKVGFDGWQATAAGEREVRKALSKQGVWVCQGILLGAPGVV